MTANQAPARGRLRELAAEEIRVLLARKRMSAAELARLTGIKTSTMSRRMTGETAFDLDDLERIAEALGVPVAALLPRIATTAVHTETGVTSMCFPLADQPTKCRPSGRSPRRERRPVSRSTVRRTRLIGDLMGEPFDVSRAMAGLSDNFALPTVA